MTEDKSTQSLVEGSRIPLLDRYGVSPVLFVVIALLVVFFLYQIVWGLGAGLAALFYLGKPAAGNVLAYRIIQGAGEVMFILLASLVLARAVTYNLKEFMRFKAANPAAVLLSFVGIFSLQQISQVYVMLQDSIKLPEPFQSKMVELKELMEGMVNLLVSSSTVPELIWVIFIIAVIPAVSEEVLFRGLIQRTLEKSIRPFWSAALTGVIFAFFHMNPFSFLPLVLIGIYLGYIAMRADSLVVSILAHFFNNAIACVAAYLRVSDDYVLVGKAGELSTGSLFLIVIFYCSVFSLSTYYFIRVTRPLESRSIVST